MVVDTSVLFEIMTEGPLRTKCEKAIAGEPLVISALTIFEIYKKLRSRLPEEQSLEAIVSLRQHEIAAVTAPVALLAADLSLEHRLPMADSLVLAHARERGETLLTLDNDFSGIEDVIVVL